MGKEMKKEEFNIVTATFEAYKRWGFAADHPRDRKVCLLKSKRCKCGNLLEVTHACAGFNLGPHKHQISK